MSKFTVAGFSYDGCSKPSQVVAKKSLFKSKEDLLTRLLKGDFDYDLDPEYNGLDFSKYSEEDIIEGNYVRYCPNMPEHFQSVGIESGYILCDKSKGAFEVYIIEVGD